MYNHSKFVFIILMSAILIISCSNEKKTNSSKDDTSLAVESEAMINVSEDATIISTSPERNLGKSDILLLSINTTTNNAINRCYLKFDFNSIELDKIEKLNLSLFKNFGSVYGAQHAGNQNFAIRAVSSNWEEKSLNWNHQFSYNSNNRVTVDKSQMINDNFENLDITQLLDGIDSRNGQSLSLELTINPEQGYGKILICSKECINENAWPRLTLKYKSDAASL